MVFNLHIVGMIQASFFCLIPHFVNLYFVSFLKRFTKLCKQCYIPQELTTNMSSSIHKTTVDSPVFEISRKLCWVWKSKQFQLKAHSTEKQFSNNTLMKEVKPTNRENVSLNICICQHCYQLLAVLDYQDFEAEIKIHHFSVE